MGIGIFGVVFFIRRLFYVNTVFQLRFPKLSQIQEVCLTKGEQTIVIQEKATIKKMNKLLKNNTSKTLGFGSSNLYSKNQRVLITIDFVLKKPESIPSDRTIDPILVYIPASPANFIAINQSVGGFHRLDLSNGIEILNYLYELFEESPPDWYEVLYGYKNQEKIQE